MRFLMELICNYLDMIFQSQGNSHTGLIQSVVNYIQQHYGEDITLDDIAAHVCLSRSYLCALFKKNMNMTINDYLAAGTRGEIYRTDEKPGVEYRGNWPEMRIFQPESLYKGIPKVYRFNAWTIQK